MATSPQQQAIEARQSADDGDGKLWSDEKTVTTAGNSAVVSLSPEEMSVLGIEVGDTVDTSISQDGFTVEASED